VARVSSTPGFADDFGVAGAAQLVPECGQLIAELPIVEDLTVVTERPPAIGRYPWLHGVFTVDDLEPLGAEHLTGFAQGLLDVAAGKITVERNDRFEDYTTSSYEV